MNTRAASKERPETPSDATIARCFNFLHGAWRWHATLAAAAIALSASGAVLAEPTDAPSPPQSVLGAGSGIKHVSILVRDLAAIDALFGKQLGFTVQRAGRFPGGLENAVVRFSDRTYLEFLAIYDPKKAALSDEAIFLKSHEGAVAFGLEMDSAERALAVLRSHGIPARIVTTMSGDYSEPGLAGPRTWLWRDIELPQETPGGPFLVEYNRSLQTARAQADPAAEQKRELSRVHANGALRLSSVWVATRDLEASIKMHQRLGFVTGRAVAIPELSANGREIIAGKGLILLLAARGGAGSAGPVSDFLAERGNGVMGVTIEVRDVTRARDYLAAHAPGILEAGKRTGGSLLIPARVAHGLWLRLSPAGTPVSHRANGQHPR